VAYRRFDTEQVRLIKEIKKYLDEGYTLSAAAKKVKLKCPAPNHCTSC
jgi:DNA-binding transcriptional MerR regulator